MNSVIALLFVHFWQIVLKELLYNGFLHGEQMTVNGKTVAENLKDVPGISELGAQVIQEGPRKIFRDPGFSLSETRDSRF